MMVNYYGSGETKKKTMMLDDESKGGNGIHIIHEARIVR